MKNQEIQTKLRDSTGNHFDGDMASEPKHLLIRGGMQLPKRANLAQETAVVLKDWIRQGVLSGHLPGELSLKRRLQIGRYTLRQALDLLTKEGWIAQGSRGKPRRIEKQNPIEHPIASVPGELLPVTVLSPFPVEHRQTLLELEETQLRLTAGGRRLLFLSPDIFHLEKPGARLERLVHSNPSSVWILNVVSSAIQKWFDESGLPAFLYELPFPGVKLPYVAFDWGAAAFHSGIRLVHEGHSNLGILEYSERRPGLVADELGLKRALATSPKPGQLLTFMDDLTPQGVVRSLEEAFSLRTPPTAFVLTRTTQVLTCYSWFLSQGIRVPKDVSVVSLPNDTWFSDLCPRLCHYAPNPQTVSRKIAERVIQIAESGKTVLGSALVPLEYIPGDTIGPCRTG